MGPGFDPKTHIEDWSDDSSEMDDSRSAHEQDDQEILDQLFSGGGLSLGGSSSQPVGGLNGL